MSTREIQNFLHNHGIFTFRTGKHSEGMLIARYNIVMAMLEYYFIPSESIPEYSKSNSNHDLSAHKRLGEMIDINSISNIQLIN